MGFKVEINFILRDDQYTDLKEGEVYKFDKSGSRLFADNLPIWLTKNDWTVLAEIQVVKQTRDGDRTYGEFEVKHVLTEEESKFQTEVFKRMYGWK
ncbi:hypothetical protein GF389_03035 [Candidatus Dojkabacteria bacterium]|nr:hypothetical protein [Candidatus Dojkabacteria bacterium]